MASGSTKIIKRRIKSVSSTKKITKAMELVAASKMRRAVDAALGTRKFAILSWNLLVNLRRSCKDVHPLLVERDVKKVLFILVTSNRGLCGGLNSNVLKKFHELVKGQYSEYKIEVIGVGKKGIAFTNKLKLPLIAAFDSMPDTPDFNDVLPLAKIVKDSYIRAEYDKVMVVYSDFVSSLVQRPKIRQILPVSERDIEKTIFEIGNETNDNKDRKLYVNEMTDEEYIFEPNKEELLNAVVPRLVETQIYQTVLEATASEHSARMLAMRSASDAAEEMLEDLTFTFNQARQAGITQELTEISAGVAAIR